MGNRSKCCSYAVARIIKYKSKLNTLGVDSTEKLAVDAQYLLVGNILAERWLWPRSEAGRTSSPGILA
ncbi:unnamed protein product [Colias eurytheme]|nr:unnamed protein product [Colias eurytheme]